MKINIGGMERKEGWKIMNIQAGGEAGFSPNKNEIDFITIASTGNAADFGDILTTTQYVSGCADSHGGLQS